MRFPQILMVLPAAFLGLMVSSSPVCAVQSPNLGAYDPKGSLATSSAMAVDHIFISWVGSGAMQQVDEAAAKAAKAQRWLMITVEPWPRAPEVTSSLLRDIAAGVYDPTIFALCERVSAIPTGVYVRWGHEMDVHSDRYPWAKNTPQEFVAAYRHFVTHCRAALAGKKDVYFVWSPAGVVGKVERFWPGPEYVDWIGLSVFDCPKCHGPPPAARSFAEIFGPKYREVRDYRKPVMVAELGVAGAPEYQARWIAKACAEAAATPQLRLLVYFNRIDAPKVWGPGPAPDWSIAPKALEACRSRNIDP